MLFVENLCTTYLRNVSLSFQANSLNAILGPSGSGKSTLLRYIAGIHETQKGTILWTQSPSAIRWIPSFMPDELRRLTLRETLECYSCSKPEEWAAEFGISKQLNVRIDSNTLSTGEIRCISLAIGLWNVPHNCVVLIDELTNGLDNAMIRKVLHVIKNIRSRTNSLVIAVVHQPTLETISSMDQVAIISEGSCLVQMPAAELVAHENSAEEMEHKLICLFSSPGTGGESLPSKEDVEPRALDLNQLRALRLPILSVLRMHWKIRLRSPALILTATLGLILCLIINIIINTNNLYTSNLLPSAPTSPVSLDVYGADAVIAPPGFSKFTGNVQDPVTAEFVSAFSRSVWSTILYGVNRYNKTDGVPIEDGIFQPLVQYFSELEPQKVNAIAEYGSQLADVATCVYETLAGNDKDELVDSYEQYASAVDPHSVDYVRASHQLLMTLDYVSVDKVDMWRNAQNCIQSNRAPLMEYLCAFPIIKPLINVLTDCLGWPRFPLFEVLDFDNTGRSIAIHSQARQLSESNVLSEAAWYDMQDTLTFANEALTSLLGRILTPTANTPAGRATFWTKRLGQVLSLMREEVLRNCNYTLCQLPLLVWPYVISLVRDLLRLIWLDVSNIAMVFVLTAVIGCTGLESAISFGDLRQMTNFYNDRSRHYWIRTLIDTTIFTVPAFLLGAIITWTLRFPLTRMATFRVVMINGVIALLGSLSAHSVSAALSGCFKNRLQGLISSATVLALFLLISGFILSRQRDIIVLNLLSYLSMFRFTYNSMVMELYGNAQSRVGVLSNEFTLKFIGGIDTQREPSTGITILILVLQITFYRVIGWIIFQYAHKTHTIVTEH